QTYGLNAIDSPPDDEPEDLQERREKTIGNRADTRGRTKFCLATRRPRLDVPEEVDGRSAGIRNARQLVQGKRGGDETTADARQRQRVTMPNSRTRVPACSSRILVRVARRAADRCRASPSMAAWAAAMR